MCIQSVEKVAEEQKKVRRRGSRHRRYPLHSQPSVRGRTIERSFVRFGRRDIKNGKDGNEDVSGFKLQRLQVPPSLRIADEVSSPDRRSPLATVSCFLSFQPELLCHMSPGNTTYCEARVQYIADRPQLLQDIYPQRNKLTRSPNDIKIRYATPMSRLVPLYWIKGGFEKSWM